MDGRRCSYDVVKTALLRSGPTCPYGYGVAVNTEYRSNTGDQHGGLTFGEATLTQFRSYRML